MDKMTDLALHYVEDVEKREPGFRPAQAAHEGVSAGTWAWAIIGTVVALVLAFAFSAF